MQPMNTWFCAQLWGQSRWHCVPLFTRRLASPRSIKNTVLFRKMLKIKMQFLVHYRSLLLVLYFINLFPLMPTFLPFVMHVWRSFFIPSKSWAYWGNPAARSQSHASFASISEIQEIVLFEIKKWNLNHIRQVSFHSDSITGTANPPPLPHTHTLKGGQTADVDESWDTIMYKPHSDKR